MTKSGFRPRLIHSPSPNFKHFAIVLALTFLVAFPLMRRMEKRHLGPSKPQGGKKGLGNWACRSSAWVSSGDVGCLSGVPAVPGSLLDLKSMIEKVTGKDALMDYGFYGCYCGWGGHGTPKDGTDW